MFLQMFSVLFIFWGNSLGFIFTLQYPFILPSCFFPLWSLTYCNFEHLSDSSLPEGSESYGFPAPLMAVCCYQAYSGGPPCGWTPAGSWSDGQTWGWPFPGVSGMDLCLNHHAGAPPHLYQHQWTYWWTSRGMWRCRAVHFLGFWRVSCCWQLCRRTPLGSGLTSCLKGPRSLYPRPLWSWPWAGGFCVGCWSALLCGCQNTVWA